MTPTPGCTASLVSNRGWTSVATLQNGRWTFDVVKPDGSSAPTATADVVIRYAFDPNTHPGRYGHRRLNGECREARSPRPIQLAKVG